MENNRKSLFRSKSIEKIESPEAMNDYLQVTSPGIWLVLAAVVVFLLGACIWGIFGRIESTTKAAVISAEGESFCLVPQNALDSVIENHLITIDGTGHELMPTSLDAEMVTDDTNVYWIIAGNLRAGDIVYRIPLSETLPEGVYSGTIVTETLSPFSLLLN